MQDLVRLCANATFYIRDRISADLGVCGGGRANTKDSCAVDVFHCPVRTRAYSAGRRLYHRQREKQEWNWALAIISSGADFEVLAFLDLGFLNYPSPTDAHHLEPWTREVDTSMDLCLFWFLSPFLPVPHHFHS